MASVPKKASKLAKITALDVSFGTALAQKARTKLHKNVNRLADVPTYVWIHHGTTANGVTDIRILMGDF